MHRLPHEGQLVGRRQAISIERRFEVAPNIPDDPRPENAAGVPMKELEDPPDMT